MKSSKFAVVFLVFALIFTIVAGCSGKNEPSGGDKKDTTAETGKEESKDTQEQPKEEDKSAEKPAWQTEKITLKFASWEDKTMESELMKAFMEKYPNITVVKDESINWPWTDALTNAASAGNLPDVFWLENVPVGVENDWLLDLAPYWDADPETKMIYPNIAKTSVYNGKRLASPTFQFIMGVFLNKTLFQKANIELPPYNWTIDQMIELAKKISNPKDHIYGLGGAWGNLAFNEHWPMANDETIGYNTFDGEKFHFTNPDWIEGYNKKIEMRKLKVEEKMTGEEKKKVFGDENAWPTQKGNVAMAIDGSWNINGLINEMKKNGTADVEFYPYPGGKAGQHMPVILDYIGVSSTTEHPEAAYELMKFMTWGKDGWLKRLELNKANNITIDKFPVSDNPDIWTQLEGMLSTEGVKAAVKLFPKAVPDFNKTLPGWRDFNVWANDEQKIFEKIDKGEFTPADKAKELEDKANEFIQQAREKIGK